MSHLTVENKKNLFATYGGSETNSGSIDAQVAMLTERINHISAHVRQNKKDFSSERGLVMMVGRRKRLLKYLAKKDINNYRSLIEKLGIRK
jgi:small subunit ribosomal protein S15